MGRFESGQEMHERERINSPETLYIAVEATIQSGRRVAFFNDFDKTVSQDGPSGGENPFDTILDPDAGNALREISNAGGIIGAISNRSGGQIAARYQDAGIDNPFDIGTYGFEKYNPLTHVSIVDNRFQPYHKIITQTLQGVRMGLLETINPKLSEMNTQFVEVTLPTPYGPIYLENKALNARFSDDPHARLTEGLAQVYNFNRVNPEYRAHLVQTMHQLFTKSLEQALQNNDSDIDQSKVMQLWGIAKTNDDPAKPGRYSFSIEPRSKLGKGFGFTQLFRTMEESGILQGKRIGLAIIADDADPGAMHASRLLESITHGEIKTANVFVDPDPDKANNRMQATSDIRVVGVNEFASVLQGISERMKQNKTNMFYNPNSL